jgi:hypothetical protein
MRKCASTKNCSPPRRAVFFISPQIRATSQENARCYDGHASGGLLGGMNTYLYANASPLFYVDATGLQGVPGACIAVGVNIASQMLSNGGDWRQIDLGEVAIAGATGFIFPGALAAFRQVATTGSTAAISAAGAGAGVRLMSALTEGGGGPYPTARLGDLFPEANNQPKRPPQSCPYDWLKDTSGPYPTGPGVILCFGR